MEREMQKLPAIALGTWSWGVGAAGGDQVFGNHLDEQDLRPVFDAAMRLGLNLWDTAVVYGMGASERILGRLARNCRREDIILSTKFTPQIAGNGENPVAEMCESSLERLGVDDIDIYWIHNPADVERWTPYLAPLVKRGKVRRVGVSNHNLAQIQRAQEILAREGVRLSAVQNHFSLLYHSSEKAGILEYCRKNDILFFSYMVLEQGALSGKYDAEHPMPAGSQRAATYNPMLARLAFLTEAMRKIGREYDATAAQIAMAWAIRKGTIPIVGVTRPRHVDDAAKAAQIRLTDAEMTTLEALAKAAGVDTRGSWELPMEERA